MLNQQRFFLLYLYKKIIFKVLTIVDFQKKHSKTSMRPMDFTCILRLSKSQLQENVFKDAVIENVHSAFMEYIVIEAHTISFPDLVVPFIIKVCCIYTY